MRRGGSYVVLFGPEPDPDCIGGAPVIGFVPLGKMNRLGFRKALNWDERDEKRRRAKAKRQAVRKGRR